MFYFPFLFSILFSGSRSQVALLCFFVFGLQVSGCTFNNFCYGFLSLIFGLQVRFSFVLGFGVRFAISVSCASGYMFDSMSFSINIVLRFLGLVSGLQFPFCCWVRQHDMYSMSLYVPFLFFCFFF